jgi:hypothetical protein
MGPKPKAKAKAKKCELQHIPLSLSLCNAASTYAHNACVIVLLCAVVCMQLWTVLKMGESSLTARKLTSTKLHYDPSRYN